MLEELKMEEIHTDNTKTLQNALDRIAELEKDMHMKAIGVVESTQKIISSELRGKKLLE